jgi:hypothetical protein
MKCPHCNKELNSPVTPLEELKVHLLSQIHLANVQEKTNRRKYPTMNWADNAKKKAIRLTNWLKAIEEIESKTKKKNGE